MSERKLKIVFLFGGIGLGGAEVQLCRYLSHLPECFEVSVMCMDVDPSPEQRKVLFEMFPHLEVVFRSPRRMNALRFAKLFFAVRKENPDVIHTYLDGTAGVFGGLLAIMLRRKWIHSSLTLEPKTSIFQSRLLRLIIRRADAVVGNAQAIVDKFVALGLRPADVHLILNGVDTRIFCSANRARKDPFTFGFLCKHRVEKRIDLLLDAVEILARDDCSFRLLLGGEGPETDSVRERVIQSDLLRKHVEMIGFVSEPSQFLQSIDALVLASDSEGTPNAILEAMSCGVPVVSTDIVNIRGIVAQSGWLCKRGDAESLAGVLRLAFSASSQELETRSFNARQYIVDHFDLELHSGVFWKLHEEVAKR